MLFLFTLTLRCCKYRNVASIKILLSLSFSVYLFLSLSLSLSLSLYLSFSLLLNQSIYLSISLCVSLSPFLSFSVSLSLSLSFTQSINLSLPLVQAERMEHKESSRRNSTAADNMTIFEQLLKGTYVLLYPSQSYHT